MCARLQYVGDVVACLILKLVPRPIPFVLTFLTHSIKPVQCLNKVEDALVARGQTGISYQL